MAHTQEGETFPEKLLSSKLERESECVFVSGGPFADKGPRNGMEYNEAYLFLRLKILAPSWCQQFAQKVAAFHVK